MVVVALWIGAYTLCLVNVSLLLQRYSTFRDRGILYFLLVVANLAVGTLVITLCTMFVKNDRLFEVVLINTLATYYVTIPLFVYETANIRVPPVSFVLIVASLFIAFNLAVWLVPVWLLYLAYFAPYLAMTLHIVVRASRDGDRAEAHPETEGKRRLRTRLMRAGEALGIISSLLMGLYVVLLHSSFGRSAFFAGAYFAVFTVLYQLPVTYFCIRVFPRLDLRFERHKQSSQELDLSRLGLTPREQEVALKLYEGLTYDQISEAMFVSLAAIKKHAYNIYRKTGVSNNRQLIRKMIG